MGELDVGCTVREAEAILRESLAEEIFNMQFSLLDAEIVESYFGAVRATEGIYADCEGRKLERDRIGLPVNERILDVLSNRFTDAMAQRPTGKIVVPITQGEYERLAEFIETLDGSIRACGAGTFIRINGPFTYAGGRENVEVVERFNRLIRHLID